MRLFLLCLLLSLLAACGGDEHRDLKKELDELTRDLHPRVAPLPEVAPHEPAQYTAQDLPDPFSPQRVELAAKAGGAGLAPDLGRRKEPLETFPIEELKIVGVISQNGRRYVVVRADKTLYQVRKGNYIGRDYGVVTDITASDVRVRELVQGPAGDWEERDLVLPLGDLAAPQQVLRVDAERVIPILFATNRKKTGLNQPESYFSDEEADPRYGEPVTLGRAMVRVPKKHVQGALEQPGWVRVTLEKMQPSMLLDAMNVERFRAVDPDQHFTFAFPIEELSPADFRRDLQRLLRASKSRAALLFVHGYANSFKDAAYRTAQLSFDLRLEGYDSVPLLYSWPSDAGRFNYVAAKDRVRSAGSRLAVFLNELVDATGIGVVHIVAHSMGAEVLVEALSKLGESNLVVVRRDGRPLPKFHQIILAAPDIRAADFRTVIAPAIASHHRVTNYASSNDAALRLSRKANAEPRAGDTEGGLMIVEGVETIDASAVNSEPLGHSYFADSPAMIRDLRGLLRDAKPEARGLMPIRRTALTYYQFP